MEESKIPGELMDLEPESKILRTNYYKKAIKKRIK